MKKVYVPILALLSLVTLFAYEKIAATEKTSMLLESIFQLGYAVCFVLLFFTAIYVKSLIGNIVFAVSKDRTKRKLLTKIVTGFFVLFFIVGFSQKGFANTYYSRQSGNWNSNTTWSTTSGGGSVGAGVFPVAGDVVIIERGATVTVNGTFACATLTVGSATNTNTGKLTFSGTNPSLTVSGTVTVGGSGNTGRTGNITFIAASTLTAGDLVLGGTGGTPAAGTIVMTAGGTLSTGSLTVNTVSGNGWTPGTGTVVMTDINTLPATIFTTFNNLTINGGTTTSSNAALTVTGNVTVSTGTLIFSATNNSYSIAKDLIVSTGATFTHSVNWDVTSKLISVAGNVSIDGLYNYTTRSHLQMTGSGKTVRSGNTSGSAFCIFTIAGGTITANGTVIVNDNFWAPIQTTGTFSTGGQTVTANEGLFVAGGTVNINGGTLNVSGGIYVGYVTFTGIVNFSSGTLNADFVNVGAGTAASAGTFNQSATATTANINGDLTISTSSSYVCTNSPAINIEGDWTNNATFTPATSVVTFNGSSNQALEGTASTTFGKLVVSNAAGITMSSNATVNSNLTLTNGLVTTGTNTVTVIAAATISGQSAASYINGKLSIGFSAAGTKVFPVGKDGNYRPVSFQYVSLSGSSTVSVEQIEAPLTTGTPALPANLDLYTARYWNISQSGASTFNYKVTLDANGYGATGTISILKKDASIVSLAATAAAPNYTMTTGLANTANLGSPSAFALASSCSAAVIGTQPAATQTVCPGTAVSFTVAASSANSASITYQWKKVGIAIAGATTSTYSISNPLAADAATYTVDVTSCGITVTSSNAVLIVNQAPAITTQPTAPSNICIGSTANFSVVATGAGLTYQWRIGTTNLIDGGTISGAASSILSISSVAAGDAAANYNCVITGACTPPTTSNNVALVINPATAISTQPAITQTTCSGTSASFTVAATGANLTYKWYNGITLITNGGAVSGATSATLTINPATTGNASANYNVVVTGTCGNVTSSNAELIVNALPTATISYNASPYCYNSGVATVTQNGQGGGTYSSTAGLAINALTGDIDLSASTPNTYTVTYSFTDGTCPSSTTTSVTIVALPTVTTANTKSICSGSSTGISLTASQSSNFSWTIGTITGSITGATASNGSTINQTLTNLGNTTAGTVQYIVTPTSTTGSCAGAAYTITVTVNPSPVVTNAATAAICSATSPAIGLTASVASSFAWTLGTVSGTISGATASNGTTINQTLTNSSTSAAGTVQYIVTPTATTGSCAGSSSTITVTVNPRPVITNTLTASNCSGSGPSINLGASAPSSFAWTIGTITGSITGATASNGSTINQTLTNPSTSAAGTVKYIVTPTATTGSCAGTASTITVTVNPNPVITNTLSTNTCSGSSPAFGLTASASSSFDWTIGAITGGIIGATNSNGSTINQTLANPSNTAAGTVKYIVTPTAITGGCVGTPSTVTVTVNPVPAVTINANYCYGGGYVQLTATAGSSYVWSTGATTQTILVNLAGTYTVAVTNSFGCTASGFINVAQELVTNGNFSAGNTGFTTFYTNNQSVYTTGTTGLELEGLYAINTNANAYHPSFFGKDHTTGTGNFMIVNGSQTATPPTVWQENIAVNANTTYYFSAWAMSLNNVSPYAQLQFNVNGTQLGTVANLTAGATTTAGPFVWTQFYGTWNSGSNTTAAISIVDLQIAAGGNDFGLDDISFGTLSPITFAINPGNGGALECVGNSLNLSANLAGGASPFTFTWTGPNSFTSNQQNPSIANVTTANSGIYALTVTDGYGCSVSGSANITVNPLPAVSNQTATICSGGAFTTTPTGTPTGTTYTWSTPTGSGFTGGAVQTTGQTSISQTLTNTTTSPVTATYTVTPTSGAGCTGNTFTITVTVNPAPVMTSTNAATICSGSSFSIPLTSNITSTYSWKATANSNVTGETTTAQSTTTAGDNLVNTTTSTQTVLYTVTPTSSPLGCAGAAQTITVTVNPMPAVSNKTAALCSSDVFTVSPSGVPSGTKYAWGVPTGSGFGGGSAQSNQSSISQSLTNTGTTAVTALYTVTPSSGTCTGSSFTVTVTVNGIPSMTSANAATICSGGTVSIPLTASITSGYSWKATSNSNTSGEQTSTQTSGTLSNTITNNTTTAQNVIFTVKPTSTAGGCDGSSQTVTVTVNPTPSVSNKTITTCSNAAFTVTPTGVPTGTTYTWSAPSGTGFSNGSAQATGQSSISQTLINVGTAAATATYNTVTPISGTCAGSSFKVTVTLNPEPVMSSAASATKCSGSAVGLTLTSSIASNYSWIAANNANTSGESTTTQTTSSINNTITNNSLVAQNVSYTVTPTSTANTCTGAAQTVTVTVNPMPSVSTQTATICSGTTFTVAPTSVPSSTLYTWTAPSGTGFNGSSAQPTGQTSISQTLANTTATAVTASYSVTPTAGVCAGSNFTVNVTVNPVISLATASLSASICANNPATINLSGLFPNTTNNTINYSINGVAQAGVAVNADASGNASFNTVVLTAANNGQTLTVTGIGNGTCTQTFTKNITLAVTSSGTWLGVNTNWFDNQNWCGGIPTSTTNVIIPSGLSYYPNVTTGIASANDITIQSGASVLVKNAQLQIAGAISNAGSFDITAGTLELNGSLPQTIAGSIFAAKTVNNLTISNTSTACVNIAATPNDTLKISGAVAFGNVNNATLNTNGNLTLLSKATTTARVADITNGGTNTGNSINGKANIERYFPSHRSWRLVTAPVSKTGAPTINASWQEGASNLSRTSPIDPHPGYGTIITKSTNVSSNGASGTADGYDQGSTTNPSLLYYKNSAWSAPSSTIGTTPNTNSGVITDAAGYMLFVRGDRNYIVTNQYQAATSSTLRVKGNLNQGTQNISGSGLQVVGNPYASSIYFDSFYLRGTNVPNYYYIWDPLLTGTNAVGAFITMKRTGVHSYTPVPDPNSADLLNIFPHSIDLDGTIQSGQAFFTYFTDGDVSVAGSTSIHETDKAAGSDALAFRPATDPSTPLSTTEKLRVNLYAQNADGTLSVEDGVLGLYNNTFSDSVNYLEDAPKLGNISETIAILRDGHSLAIEDRKIIGATDTTYYKLFGMQQKNYIIEFVSTGLNHPGLAGFLLDSFLHTRTPIDLNGTTDIKFTVSSNSLSALAQRFTVIFVPTGAAPVPVTFTSVKAQQQNDKNIAVQWNVENQLNIKEYIVQKSTDGSVFTTVNTTTAAGSSTAALTYNWVDDKPAAGDNFYRIVSMDNDGTLAYSHTVDVKTAEGNASITVYPNPVQDGKIGLQLVNEPEGKYSVQLINELGQVLLTTTINHPEGTASKIIDAGGLLAKGVYTLEVTTPDKTKASVKVITK